MVKSALMFFVLLFATLAIEVGVRAPLQPSTGQAFGFYLISALALVITVLLAALFLREARRKPLWMEAAAGLGLLAYSIAYMFQRQIVAFGMEWPWVVAAMVAWPVSLVVINRAAPKLSQGVTVVEQFRQWRRQGNVHAFWAYTILGIVAAPMVAVMVLAGLFLEVFLPSLNYPPAGKAAEQYTIEPVSDDPNNPGSLEIE